MVTIDHDPHEIRPVRRNRFGWLVAGALAALVAAGAGLAWATDVVTPGNAAQFVTKAGWGGSHGHRFEQLLDEIDATDEQADKLWDIFGNALTEMWPMMREFRSARGEALELLSVPTIDRAAVEKLRAERIAALDTASKTMADTLIQAAAVLTPEQRSKLLEHFQERGRHRRW